MQSRQSILISGASSGFGALAARTLARQGHTVFAGMRAVATRNAAAASQLVEVASHEGLELQFLELDVTDDLSVERAVIQAVETAGHLDVLVNNAGTMYVGPLEAFTPEQARWQLETNVIGALRLNRAVLPHMRARGSGLLIQISSILGRLALLFLGLYAASKFALEGLSEAYRLELAGDGIDVAIVKPGAHPTGIAAHAVMAADRSRLSAYPAAQLLPPFVAASHADPQDVADAIARLVALPAQTRPLRTIVASERERKVVEPLNAASDQAIRAVMSAGVAGAAAAAHTHER